MSLFMKLIDNKQSMVLTNAQILNILKIEFQMELSYIHELEKDIYLQCMKKFLNDWPRWDEFDEIASTMRTKQNTQGEKLKQYYNDLKIYLNRKLFEVKDLIHESMKDVVNKKEVANYDKDVVLEIRSTRSQLNELIFRRPHPDLHNSIFNIPGTPTKITVCGTRTIASIINWPSISITLNAYHMTLKRSMVPILKHKLINKKLSQLKSPPEKLNTHIQMKDLKVTSEHDKDKFLKELKLQNNFVICSSDVEKTLFSTLSNIIYTDLKTTPNLSLPAILRKKIPNYPYVRYLFSEVTTSKPLPDSNNYDLQLEETMIPQWQLSLRYDTKLCSDLGITVECGECNVSFAGAKIIEHFEEMHQAEPDWQCTKCDKTFDAICLSDSGWIHDCS
ncbi:hypothetical protein ACJJTC_002630 [Scirpophaga incertulas]